MKQIRSFIAIEINQGNRTKIVEVQKELLKANAGLKFVKPENIHITLHFLGNQDIETLNQIISHLESIFKTFPPFEFQPQGLGAFPNEKNPRVIWIGIGTGADIIENIHTKSKNLLQKIGIGLEKRKYHPHLTLARIRTIKNKHLLIQLLNSYTPPEFELQKSEEIVLFKSILTPQGPIYEKLHFWRLGQT